MISGKLKFSYYLNQIKPKGNLVYEYNPFYNYRLPRDTDINGKHRGDPDFIDDDNVIEGGSVVDLDTKLLNFSLNNPVDITIQKSYDGSDNLILNDNRNIPRLINSRFTVLPNNQYEVVDRIGNDDINIYDDTQFDQDTSLYKRINFIPKITFNGVIDSGSLKVGNYVLYIKYADADGNETDFVAESGLISCFIGNNKYPKNIQGGIQDENSHKSISLTVTNVDPAYDYIIIYFTRTSSNVDGIPITEAYKIEQKYNCLGSTSSIIITGEEQYTKIDLSEINAQYFMIDQAKTQAQCQNMLFLGNIHKPDINYVDLKDISLRILPTLNVTLAKNLIGEIDNNYNDSTNNYEYYNVNNIYNYVGYWNEEIYRFGVVYLLNDFTLSPVFNIRGTKTLPTSIADYKNITPIYDIYGDREYISIMESTFQIEGSNDNAKGVFQIPQFSQSDLQINGIRINIPKDVLSYLSGKVKGLFFVRQKRIPTILCQTLALPMDTESKLPLLKNKSGAWFIEGFLDSNLKLNQTYKERLKEVQIPDNLIQYAGICPEYDVRPAAFNQLFTGSEYVLTGFSTNKINDSSYEERRYVVDNTGNDSSFINCKIAAVPDNAPIIAIDEASYRARAGEAEEAWRFQYIEVKNKTNDNNKLVRGSFGPYLGLKSIQIQSEVIYNVRIPGYSAAKMDEYFNTRYYDDSPYYAVSDRISIEDIQKNYPIQENCYYNVCYRGDCFICTFTHRLNRNFQDPETPINDEVVDADTWATNYDINNSEKLAQINRADVNAVKLGSWITLKVLSTYNLNLRSQDYSYPTEEGLTGSPRSFYPLQQCSPDGNKKVPEASILNGGYGITTGQKVNFILPDVPFIKNRFDNRIIYSDVSVNDAFKNGYRVFQMRHYKDYPRTYGGLIKLIELNGSLLAVWEHGVGIIPVNERALAGEGVGGNVFINTSNVLPDNPKMLSDMYGSQWQESVVKTPYFIYGVDTVGKKIWRTNGQQFEIISDFKVQKFLNDNISLQEKETTPIIGIRNVKTHYNANKQDVMFTFYDNLYGIEEKAWNLCYNELMQKWVTFYSWIPSYSTNIDNVFFSFNRDTSKHISKLATTSKNSTSASGIVVATPIIDDWVNKDSYKITSLDICDRALPNDSNTGIQIVKTYTLLRDPLDNYKNFEIPENSSELIYKGPLINGSVDTSNWEYPVITLNIECLITVLINDSASQDLSDYITGWKKYIAYNADKYQSTIALTSKQIIENPTVEGLNLTTDFWKHGQAGIIDIQEKILPCHWYGKQHPFEFEIIVADNPQFHKIFNNLKIISNKAKPESFHYEIVGEVYSFAEDKKNAYIRQESTKAFYQYNGSNILYNRNFLDLKEKQRKLSTYNDKTTLFPLYYARISKYNEIEDFYKSKTSAGKDYTNLSGTEIVYDDLLGEFKVWTHAKAVDIKDPTAGRLKGNMNYQEDIWDVQINPIIFVQKNEADWNTYNDQEKVPISVGLSPIPDDLKGFDISPNQELSTYLPSELISKGYKFEDIDTSNWWNGRKETKLRDKYIKVRIRYSGEELAVITALQTLYTISYA